MGLGLSDLLLWMRKPSALPKNRAKAQRSWSEKESHCWLQGIDHSQEVLAQALKIIQYYEWRWQTEELYRTSKKKGFGIEESNLTSLDAIFKQTILSLEAAFRVIFSPDEIECLEILNQKVEGKPQKLSNPWSKDQLAWAAWVIARLGGWKGYPSRIPPGPIRMKRGLDKFNTYFDAWNLFRPIEDVGDP